MRHEAKPPMAKRKIDTAKNPDNLDETIRLFNAQYSETYPVRINRTTVVYHLKKKQQ